MTTFKHPKGTTWRYDFKWRGRRYAGSTDQLTKADADLVEADIKKRIRQQAWGIAPIDRQHTPSFSQWADTFYTVQARRLTRPDILDRTLRAVLAFWGKKPADKPRSKHATREPVTGPYHNLRLADPILEPAWIDRFEQWMTKRGLSGATKNTYRSAVSGMYRLALRPRWRAIAHITTNPMMGTERDPVRSRKATLTPEQLQAWITEAPPHVGLALAIGALAPKLRKASILSLRWDKNFDPDLQFITVHDHKTIRSTGEPQVVPIDPQLRSILEPFRAAAKRSRKKYVILFRGQPVKDIKNALGKAATRAGITYGHSGITFHSLRHTMATMLAELGIPEHLRKEVMGHSDIRTTQGYTHLRPIHEREPMAAVSAKVALKGAVQGPPARRPRNIQQKSKVGRTLTARTRRPKSRTA